MYLTYIISDKSEHVNYLLANRVVVTREMSCFKFYCFFFSFLYIYTAHIYPSLSLFTIFLKFS